MTSLTGAMRRAIAQNVAETAENNGMRIVWAADRAALDRAAEQGLLTLYRDIFAEPPYCESFTDDEVYGFFMDTIDQGGIVLTAAYPEKAGPEKAGQVGAFVSSLPLTAKKSVADHVADFVDGERTAYFAEDGVAADLRRRGVSGVMKKLLIACNNLSGFDDVLLRTSIDSLPQISAVTKAGGRVISGLFQDVASPKQGGEIAMDRRVFFLFDTAARPRETSVLNRVTVAALRGQNIAIVHDPVPAREQAGIAESLQKTYAALNRVAFHEKRALRTDPGRVVFDAKLYLPA